MILTLILLALVWMLPLNGSPIYAQRPQSQLLKFLASLTVVLGHEIMFYCPDSPQLLLSETGLGSLCVAFFLFMSGYGLQYGYLKKGGMNLSFDWLKNRMLKLCIPALTAMALYLTAKICSDRTVDWIGVMKYWFVSNDNLPYGWYVSEIICLYVAFFTCHRWINRKYALAVLTGGIISAMFVMIGLQWPVWYIQGLPCFIMGLFLAAYDTKKKSKQVSSNSWQIKIGMTLLIIGYYFFKHFDIVQEIFPALNKWRYMYASFFIVHPLFIFIMAYILMRLPVCNKMLNRGGYFYEVYLVQGATLLICRDLITQDLLFVSIGLIATVVVAKGMSVINKKIISFCQK